MFFEATSALVFISSGVKVAGSANNVANKKAYGIDRFITSRPKAKGANMLLNCIVAVLVVTA